MDTDAAGPRAGWELLAAAVRSQAPHLSAPPPGGRGLCATCRIPVRPGNVRCYQCGQHAETLPGLLADAVVPICYAAKGGEHARNLWLYKSARPGAGRAQEVLRAVLVVFLRDHGPCVWRSAGMSGPTHLAVVPSGRGRAGPHPLQALARPCLALPWVSLDLRLRDEPGSRDLDAERYWSAPAAGADVALLDDTWTTGASAQSACAALRLAGARSVAVIALGRHVSTPARAAAMPFRPWLCAVHSRAGQNGQ
jgi:ferredoxin